MATREEMIAALRGAQSAPGAQPSREEMIANLRKKAIPVAAVPPSFEPKTNAAEAMLEGFGQGATLNYLPEIQAGAAYGMERVLPESMGGGDTAYDDLKAYFENKNKLMKAEHPIPSMAGNLGGALATIPAGGLVTKGVGAGLKAIPGVMSAAKLASAVPGARAAGAVAQAGAEGAGYGFAMNPETQPGADEMDARLKNAETGAKWGAGIGAGFQGLKAGISKYLSMTSGVPKKAIEGYIKHQPEVQDMIKTEGGADYATQVHQELQDAFFAKKREIGEAIGSAISNGKGTIDPKKIFAPYDNLLNKLRNEKIPASDLEAIESEVAELKKTYMPQVDPADKLIGHTPDTALNAQDAFNLKQIAGNNANVYNISGTFRARYPKASTNIDKLWSNANLEARKIADQEIQKVANTAGLNKQYSEYSRLQDKMERYFSDPEKTFKTLQGVEAPSKEFARDTMRQIKQNLGVDLQKPSEVLEAYRYFRKPEMMPISSGGTTSTSRSVGLSGLGALLGGSLAGPAGAAVGATAGAAAHSPAMTKMYLRGERALSPLAPPAGAMPYVMSPWIGMGEQNGR
jgi:hypothetical protein